VGQFLISVGVGVLGGVVSTALLCSPALDVGEVLGTAQARLRGRPAAACDIVRDDPPDRRRRRLAVANMRGFTSQPGGRSSRPWSS
jgi:hypothetical protein